MSAHLHHKTRLLNEQRAVAVALGSLSLDCLCELIIIRAEHLAKIGM
jgi:hypothetical protein